MQKEFKGDYYAERIERALRVLREAGLGYEQVSNLLYRVRGVNFKPMSGLYHDPRTGVSGRGVQNLIELIQTYERNNTQGAG